MQAKLIKSKKWIFYIAVELFNWFQIFTGDWEQRFGVWKHCAACCCCCYNTSRNSWEYPALKYSHPAVKVRQESGTPINRENFGPMTLEQKPYSWKVPWNPEYTHRTNRILALKVSAERPSCSKLHGAHPFIDLGWKDEELGEPCWNLKLWFHGIWVSGGSWLSVSKML